VNAPRGLTIRIATPVDATGLANLAARTFRDAFGAANNPADLALHLETHYTAEVMRRELEDPGWETLLAEVDGRLAGYAQSVTRDPPLDLGAGGRMLHRFYLEQAWIGRGIAGRLMEAVQTSARRRRAQYLWLTVWQENPRAIAFYQKCGFVSRGTTTFTVGNDPQVDWVMTAPL
jgi:ribosomal protein S18 acetylase RimI-like enzyme